MPATPLRTDWVTIGTAGDTVDNRVISEQDIYDAAETYSPEYYGAVIDWNHYNPAWLGNFGDVLELRSQKATIPNEGEVLQLQAILQPNQNLVRLNQDGQAVYTSMTLVPNFRNKGKTYLIRLAVTDTPASIGTKRLEFCKKDNANALISAYSSQPLALSLNQEPEPADLFSKLTAWFNNEFKTPAGIPEEEEIMDPKQFKEFKEQQANQFAGMTASMDKLTDAITASFASKEGGSREPTEPEKKPNADKGEDGQQFNAEEKINALETKFSEFDTTLKNISDTLQKFSNEDAPGQTNNPDGGGQQAVY